jgi:hypothetical protein
LTLTEKGSESPIGPTSVVQLIPKARHVHHPSGSDLDPWELPGSQLTLDRLALHTEVFGDLAGVGELRKRLGEVGIWHAVNRPGSDGDSLALMPQATSV